MRLSKYLFLNILQENLFINKRNIVKNLFFCCLQSGDFLRDCTGNHLFQSYLQTLFYFIRQAFYRSLQNVGQTIPDPLFEDKINAS